MTFGDVWEFLSEHREHKVLRSRITLGDILDDMLKCHQKVIDAKLEIAALTARAEQAERERDAAVKDIEWAIFDAGLCNLCLNRRGDDCAEKKCKPKWRGLPQDGGAE